MKITFRMIFIGLSLTTATPQLSIAETQGPAIDTKYAAQQVSEHVYVVHGPRELPNPRNQGFMNNPGFILTNKGVVVIDAGSSKQVGEMVLGQIRAVTNMPVVASFSTHIHGDHWLGNQALVEAYPDVKLYAHINLINQAHASEADNWINLMRQLTDNATAGTVATIPNLVVGDGDSITIGGIAFDIHYKGQAHTNTDISILVNPDNTLFTGDLVFNKRFGRMNGGSFTGLSRSLDHLISLAPDVVVPGHGQTSDVSIITEMKSLNETLYQAVVEKYDEDISDFDMKPFVVEKLKGFSDWSGFTEGIGPMISLCYLEVEEDSF